VFQSTCQCGDVPMGFFILVAVSFLAMSREKRDSAPLLWTAGAAAGLAGWTKNEGALLLVVVLTVAVFTTPRFRALLHVAAGTALPALVLVLFKLRLAPPSDLVDPRGPAAIAEKLADSTRWLTVFHQMSKLLLAWGGDAPGGALGILALAIVLSVRPDRRSVARSTFGLGMVVAMLAGFALVYVVTPHPLDWQIATSFERLFTQLWPTVVWAAFQLSGSAPLGAMRRVAFTTGLQTTDRFVSEVQA
jgi:hypothetical protein